LLSQLKALLNLDIIDVPGHMLAERLEAPAERVDRAITKPFDAPVSSVGGLISLSGSLALDGAIFKRAAVTPGLFESKGRAVVSTGLDDLAARIDDPDLNVRPEDVLVLQNIGPHAAEMPEAGYFLIPHKLAQAGVKDMVRISDGRIPGTAFGSIVLHVAPKAAIGGSLAAVRNGDRISLSVKSKRIDLLVDDAEIHRPLAEVTPPPKPKRGYKSLYRECVVQASQGCDVDFLTQEGRV